jgi:3-keto-disaccharide hydrolase
VFKLRSFIICRAVVSALLLSASGSSRSLAAGDKIIGRWDMTIHEAGGGEYPSWFEATRDGDKLTGRFVGRVGSQRPIKSISFEKGHLSFSLPVQYESPKGDLKYEAELTGKRLEGTMLDSEGRTFKWTAVRARSRERKSTPRWGKPITLFNGNDLRGWTVRNGRNLPPGRSQAAIWRVVEGVLQNTPRGTDIITNQKFTDFKLHVEFKMIENSNSGVYLRGRYEVQIQDDYGKEPESHGVGGIYGFITPSSNPVKKPGEWQTFDITLLGRRVTVVFNGTTIIDNDEIPGITGGALDSHEGKPGPIMLQGDHTQIYYRNIVITPAK